MIVHQQQQGIVSLALSPSRSAHPLPHSPSVSPHFLGKLATPPTPCPSHPQIMDAICAVAPGTGTPSGPSRCQSFLSFSLPLSPSPVYPLTHWVASRSPSPAFPRSNPAQFRPQIHAPFTHRSWVLFELWCKAQAHPLDAPGAHVAVLGYGVDWSPIMQVRASGLLKYSQLSCYSISCITILCTMWQKCGGI